MIFHSRLKWHSSEIYELHVENLGHFTGQSNLLPMLYEEKSKIFQAAFILEDGYIFQLIRNDDRPLELEESKGFPQGTKNPKSATMQSSIEKEGRRTNTLAHDDSWVGFKFQ
mgnify:CR=1 FL=1